MTKILNADFTSELTDLVTTSFGANSTLDIYDLLRRATEHHVDTFEGIIKKALQIAHVQGLLQACPNNEGYNSSAMWHWNDMVERGVNQVESHVVGWAIYKLGKEMRMHIMRWCYDRDGSAAIAHPNLPHTVSAILHYGTYNKTVSPQDITSLVSVMNTFLLSPQTMRYETGDMDDRSTRDHAPIAVMFDGYAPVIALKTDDGPLEVAPLLEALPPVRHYTLKTTGKVAVFGMHDNDPRIVEAVHNIVCNVAGLGIDFNADTGANRNALDVYAICGILPFHFGDHFPQPFIESRGMIRGLWEDMEFIPPQLSRTSAYLDKPAIVALDDLVALVGIEAISEAIDAGAILIHDVEPGDLHVYAPDGWRVSEFEAIFEGDDLPNELVSTPEGQTCFVVSQEELSFRSEIVTHVDMPERRVLESKNEENIEDGFL